MTSEPGRISEETQGRSNSSMLAGRLVYALLLFFAGAASFNGYFTKVGFREGDSARGIQPILDGSASRPYVYRQLVPLAANLISRAVPKAFQQKLASLRSDDGLGFYSTLFSSPVALDPNYSFRYFVFYLVVLAGAVLASFAFYGLCRVEGHSSQISLISASLFVLLIPYIQTRGGGYYDDFPEAALIGLALILARRAHWLWLIPVASLGALNKETFVLVLLALWPILAERSTRLFASLQVAVLEIAAGCIYMANRFRFAHNPGGTAEFHLKDQISYLSHPGLWLFKFGKAYGVFLPELATIVPALLLLWIIWRSWRNISLGIRRFAWILMAMNFPLFLLFCMPGETRDLSLLYAVVLLSIATTLTQAHRARALEHSRPAGTFEVIPPVGWERVRSES